MGGSETVCGRTQWVGAKERGEREELLSAGAALITVDGTKEP